MDSWPTRASGAGGHGDFVLWCTSLLPLRRPIEAYLWQRPPLLQLYEQMHLAAGRGETATLCRQLASQRGLFCREAADLHRQLAAEQESLIRGIYMQPPLRLLRTLQRAADADAGGSAGSLRGELAAAGDSEVMALACGLAFASHAWQWEDVPAQQAARRQGMGGPRQCSTCARLMARMGRGSLDSMALAAERALGEVQRALESLHGLDMGNIGALLDARSQVAAALEKARLLGAAEVDLIDAERRRRLIHNTVEDLRGSIRLCCRIRPLVAGERDRGEAHAIRRVDATTVEVAGERFTFDVVLMPGDQEEVFEECRDLAQSALDGYNVTLFAYGQTSAGKTHTTFGDDGNPGVAPRMAHEIFRLVKDDSRFTHVVAASMLELYRSDLVDLLSKGRQSPAAARKPNLRLDKEGAVQFEHLVEEACGSAADLMSVIDRGLQQRKVATTLMNSESSRSHAILVVKISRVNRETQAQSHGKILLCDLAGSERLKRSMVTGETQKDSIETNKSLTALGDVIEALTQQRKQIPYRNHKLTQIMQDSLGKSSKTMMFLACSPARSDTDETLMSLKWATRAKRIVAAARGPSRSASLPRLKDAAQLHREALASAAILGGG
mmetsp:Transcript_26219/g.74104  ORF Transcript_26219/g.74104 Transcript_26219/m.74104 type:complete len:613 (-) Transcript_26219:120-1958(-)